MNDIQAFRALVSARQDYLRSCHKPLTAGDPFVLPILLDVRGTSPQASLLTNIPIENTLSSPRAISRTIAFANQLLNDDYFHSTPNPTIKRPINGAAEGWTTMHINESGDLNTVIAKGGVPFRTPTFEKGGWLLDYMTLDEVVIIGRYRYWRDTYEAGELLAQPIPAIAFVDKPHPKVASYLEHWLDQINPLWRISPQERAIAFEKLIDWLLWGFGHPISSVPPLNDEIHSKLYQLATFIPFFLHPYDYFGAFLEAHDPLRAKEISSKKVKELTADLFPFRGMDARAQLLVEPDVGTGRLLLALSNHSFNLLGLSSDPLTAKIALLNCYLYAPWAIFPFEFLDRDLSDTEIQFALGRTLTMMKRKKGDRDYFSITEPDPFGFLYQPIQMRRPREQAVLPTRPHNPLAELMPSNPSSNSLPPQTPLAELMPSSPSLNSLPPQTPLAELMAASSSLNSLLPTAPQNVPELPAEKPLSLPQASPLSVPSSNEL